MIILEEYPAFNIKDMAKSSAKDDIIQAIVNDLFACYDITTTADIDTYVSIVNYRLEMHYYRFFDNHEYKFKAKYSSDDNSLNLDLYRDGELYELYSLLDTITDNIKKEWDNL